MVKTPAPIILATTRNVADQSPNGCLGVASLGSASGRFESGKVKLSILPGMKNVHQTCQSRAIQVCRPIGRLQQRLPMNEPPVLEPPVGVHDYFWSDFYRCASRLQHITCKYSDISINGMKIALLRVETAGNLPFWRCHPTVIRGNECQNSQFQPIRKTRGLPRWR